MKLKLIFTNLLVFAGLVIFLNLISWIFYNYRYQTIHEDRDQLPNYEDKAYAKKIFDEFHDLKTGYEPFIGWSRLPYTGETTTINESGDRVHKISGNFTKVNREVRFFGGSTTWGSGSDDQHTYPALFNKLNPNYKIFNHGESGFNSRQCLDRLISIISTGQKLDLVVFYLGVNEIHSLCRQEVDVPGHLKMEDIQIALTRKKDLPLLAESIKLITYKYLLKLTFRMRNKFIGKYIDQAIDNSGYNCYGNDKKVNAITETFFNNLEMAHTLVTSKGGTFIAILEPVIFTGNARKDHLKLNSDREKNFLVVYPEFRKRLASTNHSWIYDFTGIFNDTDDYIYIDFCHVTPNGNEIIANKINAVVQSVRSEQFLNAFVEKGSPTKR